MTALLMSGAGPGGDGRPWDASGRGPGNGSRAAVSEAPHATPDAGATGISLPTDSGAPAGISLGDGAAALGAPSALGTPAALGSPVALASTVRPARVLRERDARALLEAAARADVRRGGHFAAGRAGIQVWSGPFDGPDGGSGRAEHLGSVDWSYDTPVRYYATIYRSMVTAAGLAAGMDTAAVLDAVLGLAGLSREGSVVEMPLPPTRDPFRRLGR